MKNIINELNDYASCKEEEIADLQEKIKINHTTLGARMCECLQFLEKKYKEASQRKYAMGCVDCDLSIKERLEVCRYFEERGLNGLLPFGHCFTMLDVKIMVVDMLDLVYCNKNRERLFMVEKALRPKKT